MKTTLRYRRRRAGTSEYTITGGAGHTLLPSTVNPGTHYTLTVASGTYVGSYEIVNAAVTSGRPIRFYEQVAAVESPADTFTPIISGVIWPTNVTIEAVFEWFLGGVGQGAGTGDDPITDGSASSLINRETISNTNGVVVDVNNIDDDPLNVTARSSATIATIVAAASGDKCWAPTDDETQMAKLYNDSVGNVVNGDPVGRIVPVSGIDLLQSVSGDRMTWNSTDNLLASGGGTISITESAGFTATTLVMFVANIPVAEDQGILVSGFAGSGSNYAFVFDDASSSTTLSSLAGTPTLKVNGTTFSGSTRDDLHTAVALGADAVYEITLDASHVNWSTMVLFGYEAASGFDIADAAARFGDIIVISDSSLPSAGDITTMREELATRHSITLP